MAKEKEEALLKQVTLSGRRSPKAVEIPEKIQAPMRKRLRMVRQSRQIPRNAIKSLGPQTVRHKEEEDLSSMRIGDLYGLSIEYGISLPEMIEYLIGKIDTGTSAEDRRVHRMIVYLQSMPDELQEVACDLTQRLAVYHTEDGVPQLRRDSRAALRERLEDVSEEG